MNENDEKRFNELLLPDLWLEQVQQKGNKEKEEDNLNLLVDLVKDDDLFLDANGIAYAAIIVNGNEEIVALKSNKFKAFLSSNAKQLTGKYMKSAAIKGIIENIETRAIMTGNTRKLDIRISGNCHKIYYDLADDKSQVIEINKGTWCVTSTPPRIFKRLAHQSMQCIPDKIGNVNKIFEFINIRQQDRLLFLVYLISCFVPDIPHPICFFYGERGAAKTTTAKVMKQLIDPSILETMSFPKNTEELIQIISHNWFCNFDNLSTISAQVSDVLCRAVTGEGYVKRSLFTNDDDFLYSYRTCICLNGINQLASKEDLLDRCLIFKLERIEETDRKDEASFWNSFEKAKPEILGGIFTILSGAIIPYIVTKHDKLFRMADFTRWGYAIAESIGKKGNQFIKDYESCICIQDEEVLESNSFASAVSIFADEKKDWSGKTSELLKHLEDIAKREKLDINSSDFPSSCYSVTKKLNSLQSVLRSRGITFQSKHTSNANIIRIIKCSCEAPKAINLSIDEATLGVIKYNCVGEVH